MNERFGTVTAKADRTALEQLRHELKKTERDVQDNHKSLSTMATAISQLHEQVAGWVHEPAVLHAA